MPIHASCKFFTLDVDDNIGHCYQATPQTYKGDTESSQTIYWPKVDKNKPACGNWGYRL